MTLVNAGSLIAWPGLSLLSNAPSITTDFTLEGGTTEYFCLVQSAPFDMTISHIGYRASTATGSPAIEASVQTIDGSGIPSGLWAANTNGSNSPTSNTNNLIALTASATVTKGQIFGLQLKCTSGTSLIVPRLANINQAKTTLPYVVSDASGSAVKSRANVQLIYAGNSSTTFYSLPQCGAANSTTGNTFNNTSSAKQGLRFQVPFKCRCVGMSWFNSNASGDYAIILMDDSGAELSSSSTAFDGDVNAALATATLQAMFDHTVTLSANTWYRAVVEPSSATNVNVTTVTTPGSDYLSSWPGLSKAVYTTYNGSWTDSTTTFPLMDILIDQVDDGAGSGGGRSPYTSMLQPIGSGI